MDEARNTIAEVERLFETTEAQQGSFINAFQWTIFDLYYIVSWSQTTTPSSC